MTAGFDDNLQCDLDRLVDDELADDERRSLLARLEHTPDGWRQCALAFLEAQSWRQELPALAQSLTALPPAPLQGVARPAAGWQRVLPTLLAMAASFALAFWLGLELRTPVASDSAGLQLAQRAAKSASVPEAQAGVPVDAAESGEEEPLWLAVGSADSADGTPQLTPVSNRTVRELSRTHQLTGRHELWPVEYTDGRRAILPVERIDLRYLGDDYQ